MTVGEIAERLRLQILTENTDLGRDITGGYVSDLLSDVMAHSHSGNVWITLQTHSNIVAVATLKELAAIILVNARTPDSDTLMRAQEKHVTLLSSPLPAFELVGSLYELGVRGRG